MSTHLPPPDRVLLDSVQARALYLAQARSLDRHSIYAAALLLDLHTPIPIFPICHTPFSPYVRN